MVAFLLLLHIFRLSLCVLRVKIGAFFVIRFALRDTCRVGNRFCKLFMLVIMDSASSSILPIDLYYDAHILMLLTFHSEHTIRALIVFGQK